MARASRSLTSAPSQSGSASWLALLTTTTLGSRSHILRAVVSGDPGCQTPPAQPLRLIVQVYPLRALAQGKIQPWARPFASAQRAVTREELLDAVQIHLVDFRRSSLDARDPSVVVAWAEPGMPDLELDGADARPNQHLPRALASLRTGQRLIKLRFADPQG